MGFKLGIEGWGMDDLELDLHCLDELKLTYRVMDEMKELNLESMDVIWYI